MSPTKASNPLQQKGRKPARVAAEGREASSLLQARLFAEAGAKVESGEQRDLFGDYVQRREATGSASNPAQSAIDGTIQRKVGFEIEVLGRRIAEPDDEEDEQRHLTKGEVLHQGEGWKLTPDGKIDNNWTPEYVVAAVDETTGTDELLERVGAVAGHAQNDLADPTRWSAGENLATYDDLEEILGSFHITGGLRLSRISELIKVLYHGQDAADAGTDKALANRAEAISLSGANYKSVVALVALQIKDLTNGPAPADGTSAKLGVSLLSRTDLGAVVRKVTTFTSNTTFIAEVLQTAGVDGATNLFRHQLPGADARGRTIDDQQNLTARGWLEQLLTGHDFVWSETPNDQGQNFGYDKVGPSTLGHRADGVILELRGGILEQGQYSPRVADWTATAARYARLFRMLNAKEDSASIIRAFHGEDQAV
jgi:hypothetical protein